MHLFMSSIRLYLLFIILEASRIPTEFHSSSRVGIFPPDPLSLANSLFEKSSGTYLFMYRIPCRSNAYGDQDAHPKLDIEHSIQWGDSSGPTPLSSPLRALQYAAPQKGFQTCGIFIWNLEKSIFNPNCLKIDSKKRKKEQSIHPTPPHHPLQPQPQTIFAVTRAALIPIHKPFLNESTLFILVMVD